MTDSPSALLPPPTPFQKIALTLSGGGFRAAAFGLGALSYLNRIQYQGKPLLENVQFIATASGGTLPGILYSSYKCKGIPFVDFYKKLRNEILNGSDLTEKAVGYLNDNKIWKHYSKSKNLINAFAIAYDKYFEEEQLGVYWKNGPALEVCFNSAEFVFGRTFRFQTWEKNNPQSGLLGNFYLRVKPSNDDAIKKIRLGDIMAASSCFPGGFEPMVFPDDFAQNESHNNQLKGLIRIACNNNKYGSDIPYPKNFSLMDGGITDNQGMESMSLEFKRSKKNGSPYDLILICDVASYFITPYEEAREKKTFPFSQITTRFITLLHQFAFIPFFISLYLASQELWPGFFYPLATITASMSVIYWGLYLLLSTKSYKKLLGETLWKKAVDPVMAFFTSRKITGATQLVKSRIASVAKILTDIQLLQIRRLNYDFFFNMRDYNMRIKMVSIYKLSCSNQTPLAQQYATFVNSGMSNQGKLIHQQVQMLQANTAIMQVAESARAMNTTLWFGDADCSNNRRDDIIACGQFTTCHNLLEYCYALLNDNAFQLYHPDISKLILVLEEDWRQFQANPHFLV